MAYSYYTYSTTDITKEDIIQFYKEQYLMFKKIGVGGLTRSKTEITEKLIRCTANRLDQLIKGKKTVDNMCYTEKLIKLCGRDLGDISAGEKKPHGSNRSFCSNITSKFDIRDLTSMQSESVCNYIDYGYGEYNIITNYIDKYTTAYNSEIVMANLSHDN
jgi:hypothetical protein